MLCNFYNCIMMYNTFVLAKFLELVRNELSTIICSKNFNLLFNLFLYPDFFSMSKHYKWLILILHKEDPNLWEKSSLNTIKYCAQPFEVTRAGLCTSTWMYSNIPLLLSLEVVKLNHFYSLNKQYLQISSL